MAEHHVTPRIVAALLTVGAITLAACGSDDSGAELPPVTDSATAEPDAGAADQGDADDGGSDAAPPEGEVIGSGNVGGTVVDPKPHPIDDIAIAESYPEQLMVRFTSGDPNCTAADATATVTGATVVVTLEVGITEDALSRSCVAGDFEQTVSIPLQVGLDGRDVIIAEP